MTGQVKEELLTRAGELGLRVADGRVAFEPRLLRAGEFHASPVAWDVIHADGTDERIDLPAGALGFTLMGVPVVYERSSRGAGGSIVTGDGRRVAYDGAALPAEWSAALVGRTGEARRIVVRVAPDRLIEG